LASLIPQAFSADHFGTRVSSTLAASNRYCGAWRHRTSRFGQSNRPLRRSGAGSSIRKRTFVRWQSLIFTLLPGPDLVEFGQRSFKFVIEEPHRIENFAEGSGRFSPVSLSKREDAIVSQVSYDGQVRNPIVG
jgi:hypothetical protein